MFTLHHRDVRPQFILSELSLVAGTAQPKQRRGVVRATRVFQAGFAVCAEFDSVLANLLSMPERGALDLPCLAP